MQSDQSDLLNDDREVGSANARRTPPHLSTSTLNGIRVTLKSTIELSEYLMSLGEGFQYVLMSRLGQDSLEIVASYLCNSRM
jgi:hypothetical protein